MYQASRRILLELKMWCDLAMCAVALLCASSLVTRPFWQKDVLLIQHPVLQLLLLLMLIGGWHLSLVLAGMYRSFRTGSYAETLASMAYALTWAMAWTAFWILLHNMLAGNGGFWTLPMTLELLLFTAFNAALLLLTRVMWRATLEGLRRRGKNLRYVLIVGTNKRAIRIADTLLANHSTENRVVGFVDDCWHDKGASAAYQSMLVGGIDQIPELLRTLVLDEVVVVLPLASTYGKVQNIFHECSQQGVLTRCEVSLFDPANISGSDQNVPLHLVTLHHRVRNGVAVSAKRALDFSVALIAISVLLPVFALCAFFIKATSPGPVFFLQERLGVGKRKFKIFKFRTMVPDAERLMGAVEHLNQSQGPTFKLANDPRITRVGSFLRKTSLDELPQLFNVLLGDMSLVGPRPLPLRDYNGFSEDWHRRRFSVKPGITCLWQIMGRSAISFDRWMKLDMDYIDSWSLWLDIKILFRTIPVVLRGSGAV